jgi:SAM-dependent methyltransferase
VVVLNNALEHLYYPVEAINKIYKILKKEGLLIVNLPNYNSFGRHIFKGNWMALQIPRHLYHFSPKILSKIFKIAGFRKIRVQYNYFSQNYYILFQSFRYLMSPKFKKGEKGGMAKLDKSQNLSFKKEIGKLLFKIVSFGLALIEQNLGRGENMIIYGKK